MLSVIAALELVNVAKWANSFAQVPTLSELRRGAERIWHNRRRQSTCNHFDSASTASSEYLMCKVVSVWLVVLGTLFSSTATTFHVSAASTTFEEFTCVYEKAHP